ncbi:rod-binding protein [bacterium]|nr:rod-binding protein [bacterium]
MKLDTEAMFQQLNQSKLSKNLLRKAQFNQEDTKAYNKKLRDACDGFEEIFVHKLIQVMRSSSDKETLLTGGRGEEIFQDMLDENYAKLISQNRALGLSDLIYEQTKKS